MILIDVNTKRVEVERSDKKEGIIDYLFKKSGSEGKRRDRIRIIPPKDGVKVQDHGT